MQLMDALYKIEVDRRLALLRITLSGFFTIDDVQRWIADRRAALSQIAVGPGQHIVLTDIRDCKVLSQEVHAAIGAATNDPRWRACRVAIVVDGALARMQAQRMFSVDHAKCFEDPEQALAWLLETELVNGPSPWRRQRLSRLDVPPVF